MGFCEPLEGSVFVEALQRGSPKPSSPFRRFAVCVDGSEMGETLSVCATRRSLPRRSGYH